MVEVVWVLGPPTAPPIKMIVGLMVVILHHLVVDIINIFLVFVLYLVPLIVMVEVLWVLVSTTSPPRRWILGQMCMMVDLGHFYEIVQHLPLIHIGLVMAKFVMLLVLRLVVLLVR